MSTTTAFTSQASLSLTLVVSNDLDAPNLSIAFWNSRPLFKQIRKFAHYHCVSPDALLGHCLARTAAMLPHQTKMFSTPKPGGLSLLIAIVGDPGASKTQAMELGRLVMPPPGVLDCSFSLAEMIDGLGISSGPGLIEQFMGENNGERVQVRHNGLFLCDEGSVLKAIASRTGEILDEVLRCIFAGTPLSTPNATKDRFRHVDAYTIGVVINLPPKSVGLILSQCDDGSPQRFLWFRAIDPTIPDLPEECPAPRIALPKRSVEVQFEPSIVAAIRRQRVQRTRGEVTVDPLNVHLGWVQAKVAAIFALWDGGRTLVTRDDWKLAGQVIKASCATRRDAAARHAAIEHARQVEEGQAAGVRQSAASEIREAGIILREALRVARLVRTEGPVTEGRLKNRLRHDHRHLWDEVSNLALAKDWLIRTDDGRRYAEGSVEPPGR